jgi:hypothetical protein
MDANLAAIDTNTAAILTKTDITSFAAAQTSVSSLQSQITALTQAINNKLGTSGGVVTGPIQSQSAQTITSGGAELARLDTVDAKIQAAIAAIAITPPNPVNAPTVGTQPVIRVQGGGAATTGAILEIATAGTFNGTPDSTTRLWLANGATPAGTNTGTTYTTLATDVGKVITLVYTAIKATFTNVTNVSNGIQVLAPAVPVLLTSSSLVESPAGTYTITDAVWDVAVTKAYQVYVGGVLVKSGSGANVYVAGTADVGKLIFIRTLPSYGGQSLASVDTPSMTVNGPWYAPNPSVAIPTASPAPDVPGAITITALGGNSYGLTTTFDNAPNGRLDWYYNTSATGTALTDTYIGSSPGINVAVLFINPNSAIYVRAKSQNSTGSSAYTAYKQLATQTPPVTIAPLAWEDSRIVYWVRTSKTNANIVDRVATKMGPGAWMGAQMAPEANLRDMSEPRTQPNSLQGNVQQLVFGRGGVGTTEEGWFKHRIFNGMPPWGDPTDYRLRSSVTGPLSTSAPTTEAYRHGPFLLGQTYWFGFGVKLLSDCFATSPNEDYWTSMGGWHHWSGNPVSGQVPFIIYINQNGYEGRVIWDPVVQNLSTSPTGVTGITNESHTNTSYLKRVTTMVATRAQCENIPHFFAIQCRFHWDYNANPKPFFKVYRQIGVDGTIELLGNWTIPTTFYQPAEYHNLYPNQGMHYWHPSITYGTTRSIDRTGSILIQDDGAVTAQQVFDSVTADIPRTSSGGGGGGGGTSSTIAVDFTTAVKQVTMAGGTTDTQTHTGNFTAGRTAILTLSHFNGNTPVSRIASVTIGGTAAVRDTQTPSPTSTFVYETWRATNMVGGTPNIEVTTEASASNHFLTYAVTQVGALSLTPVDSPTKAYNTGTSVSPSISMGSTGAQANEIAFAGFTWSDSGDSTITAPSGWTEAWQHTNGTTDMPGACAYKILSSTNIDTASWTLGTAWTWYTSIVTYKAA